MRPDPPIDEIREIRHQISHKFNNDPKKIVEYYIQFQKKYQDRLINLSELKDKDILEKVTKA